MNAGQQDDEPGDDVLAELSDIAGGDPHTATLLRRSLERLRDGAAGAALQEMAREVLAGHTTLRSATGFSFYQEALTARLDEFHEWRRTADPADIDSAVHDARTATASDPETDQGPR